MKGLHERFFATQLDKIMFSCGTKREAYFDDGGFRFCPSCGMRLDETDKTANNSRNYV